MDRIATWAKNERETLFLDSAERLPHLRPSLIEKDFWVCWLLRRLFLLDQEVPMIFKGGTSISKAYPIIRRFSEDIDLSLDRGVLGYGEVELDAASSKKAFKNLLEELRTAAVQQGAHPASDGRRIRRHQLVGAGGDGGGAFGVLPEGEARHALLQFPPKPRIT